jgi:hypothetical protein
MFIGHTKRPCSNNYVIMIGSLIIISADTVTTMNQLQLTSGAIPLNCVLPLVSSVPFVNVDWKTDLFTVSSWLDNRVRSQPYVDQTRDRLLEVDYGDTLFSFRCMLDLAKRVDDLTVAIVRADIREEIGLGKNDQIDGYQVPKDVLGLFVEGLTSAIVLDRMLLAATDADSPTSPQLLHPYSHNFLKYDLDVAQCQRNSREMLLSLSTLPCDVVAQGRPGSVNYESALKLSAASFALQSNSSGIISNIFRTFCVILHLCTVGRFHLPFSSIDIRSESIL